MATIVRNIFEEFFNVWSFVTLWEWYFVPLQWRKSYSLLKVCVLLWVLGPCILAIIITGTQKHTDHNNRYSVLFLSTLKGCKYTWPSAQCLVYEEKHNNRSIFRTAQDWTPQVIYLLQLHCAHTVTLQVIMCYSTPKATIQHAIAHQLILLRTTFIFRLSNSSSSRSWSMMDMPLARAPRTFLCLGVNLRMGVGLRGRASAVEISWGICVCVCKRVARDLDGKTEELGDAS